MAGSYTLELEVFGVFTTNAPSLEIWEDGALDSTHVVSSTGTTISVTINYGGALPTSLAFTFNDAFAANGRTIEIRSVKINDEYVNVGNYLDTDSLTKSTSANVDVVTSDFIFDPSDPAASEFTIGATQTFTAGADTFRDYASGSNEIFDMLGGRDVAYLGSGNDKVSGGAGNDVIYSGAGNDLVSGGADNDRIYGGAGVDELYGGLGNDRIHGGTGDDEIHGGAGVDRLNGQVGNDTITGGAGADKLSGGSGNDILYGGADNDQLVGGTGADTLDGGIGDDVAYGGTGNDHINGGDGLDILIGGTGADTIHGDAGDDSIYGGADNDTIYGGADNDIVNGGTGDDTIDGGDGDDVLVGGDVQLIDTTTQISYGGSQDVAGTVTQFTGGMTLDGNLWKKVQVDYTVTTNTIIEFDFKSTLEAEVSGIGFDNDDVIDSNATFEIFGTQTWGRQNFANYDGSGDWTHYTIDVGTYYTGTFTHLFFASDDDDNSPATGTDGNSSWANITIYESTLADDTDILDGGAGNDQILGNKGDDTLSGGAGADNISGNDGNDTLNGDAGDDILHGGSGNDTLDGGANNDEIYGDDGNDTIILDLGNDTIDGGAGTDVIDASAYTTFVRIDLSNLAAQNTRMGMDTISNIEDLIGTDFNDILSGDSGDNTIDGGVGTDVIRGNGGADILNGEAGNDDFYISGTVAYDDIFNGGADSDDLYLEADSFLNSTVTFVDMERVVFGGFRITAALNDGFDLVGMTRSGTSNLYGQGGSETIGGTESDDNIYGGAGSDILIGNGGQDNFFVSGNDSLGDQYDGGAGTDDEIHLQADSYFNGANSFTSIEQMVFGGFDVYIASGETVDFTGMDRSGVGEIYGDVGNETITGMDNADYMYGLGGADTLNGGSGADFLYGGTGNDTINGGTENDDIYGEAGADILNGDAGNDDFFISGTDGVGDVYDGGADSDDIYLSSNIFLDLTTTFTNMERVVFGGFTVTANVGTGFDLSGMTASGTSNLYGQGGAETITGTESTDNIYGGIGADILIGGGGNDNFYVSGNESLGDQYDGGTGGDDEIILQADSSFNSANSFTGLEQVVFGGFDVLIASGATVDFTGITRSGTGNIIGDVGNETITGMDNGDDIYGGLGADTMSGGGGNDDFFITGAESLGDVYDGGAGTNYIRMSADSDFNSANSFANITSIINGGFDMNLVAGTTIDFSGMNRSGGGGIVGTASVETITGFDNTNVFYGMGGADTMIGGSGNDDFYVSGNESLGDIYDGGSGGTDDEIRLLADSSFNSANSFTSIEQIVFGGFDVLIASGATVDFTGITKSGAGNIVGDTGNETIHGMDNNDYIYGGSGNDILYGGDGRDELYGEGGADTFVLENATAFNDIERIRDFSTAESDALDIQDLLSGYTFGVDDLTQFVQIVDAGANSNVFVDTTGGGTFGATERVGTLYGITGLTDEVALETAGNLITH